MAKKVKPKKKFKDFPLEARNRIIGGIICLVSLITAFVVGLFVGSFIPSNKAKAMENVEQNFNTDDLYSFYFYGDYYFIDFLDISTVEYSSMYEFVSNYRNQVLDFPMVQLLGIENSPLPPSYQFSLRILNSTGNLQVGLFERRTQYTSWTPVVVSYYDSSTLEFLYTECVFNGIRFNEFVSTGDTYLYDGVFDMLSTFFQDSYRTYFIGELDNISFSNFTDSANVDDIVRGNFDTSWAFGYYPFFYEFVPSYVVGDFLNAESDTGGLISYVLQGNNNAVFYVSYTGNPTNILTVEKIGSVYDYNLIVDNYYELGEYYEFSVYPVLDATGNTTNKFVCVPHFKGMTYQAYLFLTIPESAPYDTLETITYNGVDSSGFSNYPFGGGFVCVLTVSDTDIDPRVQVFVRVFFVPEDIGSGIDLGGFIDWIFLPLGVLLSFSIMPGLSIGSILGVIIVLCFAIWVIKLVAGG